MNDPKTKIKALEKALHELRPYSAHALNCVMRDGNDWKMAKCNCGFVAALKKAEKALNIKV